MCGIIVSSIDIPNNYNFIQNRGPENTNKVTINNINFIHFLLHLTGEKIFQPLISDDKSIVCIFNGEIYNYKNINPNANIEGDVIIELYKKYDSKFIKYLDGEFTIVLFDFIKKVFFICSDVFKTKPLFYNLKDHIIISSYETICNNIKKQNYSSIKPNEMLMFDLNTRYLLNKYQLYNFDLNQIKINYDDYCSALENAILKRYPEKTIPLISLSSGHDSGVIVACLHKYKKNFIAISINKNENNEVLQARKQLLKDKMIFIELDENEKKSWKEYLYKNCEPFNWDWTYHPKMKNYKPNGFDMGSMLGKCKILNIAKKNDNTTNIMYSGIGADEVMALNSYYSQGYGNVDFFPNNLNNVFPWANFFNGSMENYLKGDEYVGGCFSFETRYPFCDTHLIQEFLWLNSDLKNNYNGCLYKPALTYYLQKENFPYHTKKYGFNV